jgi:hypothetical protein
VSLCSTWPLAAGRAVQCSAVQCSTAQHIHILAFFPWQNQSHTEARRSATGERPNEEGQTDRPSEGAEATADEDTLMA